jgi:hypothetical protein
MEKNETQELEILDQDKKDNNKDDKKEETADDEWFVLYSGNDQNAKSSLNYDRQDTIDLTKISVIRLKWRF